MKLKKAGFLLILVLLAGLLYASFDLARVREGIVQAQEKTEELQQQADNLEQANAGLKYNIEHAGDQQTIESIARSKLGLVKPGEKVFIDVGY